MAVTLIGRKKEQSILKDLLTSNESEFVALYGRMRVGKTFLVETVYRKEIVFSITGLNKVGKALQLENFTNVLNAQLSGTAQIPTPPKSWLKAFDILKHYLEDVRPWHQLGWEQYNTLWMPNNGNQCPSLSLQKR